LAKFQLCKVANNTWKETTQKEKGQEDKKCPIHDALHPQYSPFEWCSYEAASSESKGEWGKNMCNLSWKEGRSLFAVPGKRQKEDLANEPSSSRGEAFYFFLASGYAV
jgi:hypothetical protein